MLGVFILTNLRKCIGMITNQCFLFSFIRTSISNIDAIEISRDNYMPVIDRFDMKFDSSASDNIRAIWSYTLALLQTSEKQIGNYLGVFIFDEPTQHSIGAEDVLANAETAARCIRGAFRQKILTGMRNIWESHTNSLLIFT